uniref:VOC domain-containing protein n=1 Tax=Hucho hucho TaxID=62062 RepID=A0A4W5NYQ1_9TELE
MVTLRRALHFVFKMGDRSKTETFYRDVLGVKILRHKEFEEGCKATGNGPYDGNNIISGTDRDGSLASPSQETMQYFVFLCITSYIAVSNDKWLGWQLNEVGKGLYLVEAPGGYHFYLVDKEQPPNDPVQKVCLAGSDLQKSIHCCSSLLVMKVKESNEETVLMGFAATQCKLELHNIVGTVDQGTAFGRIELSCPREQLADLEALMTKGNHKILTILVSLDTPGKAWLAWTPLVLLGDPESNSHQSTT